MITRRTLLRGAASCALGAVVAPFIVPASAFGANAPSNRINVGAIGNGRISRSHDLPNIWKYDHARIVAACDLDSKRANNARILINDYYSKKNGKSYKGVSIYHHYTDLLVNPDIDAVVISTPDHWHAKAAIDAVNAGKDVYLQKPMSLTIEEGRKISDAVNRSGRIFQIGSQYRSMEAYRVGCELIRNGRIGNLTEVDVRMPVDPSGGRTDEMPIPSGFDYDTWLGSTPEVYYTEDRVHPIADYGRPGWLRCEQFGAGMITGWGAHLFDISQWGMGTEHTGPIEIISRSTFPTSGLWNVHGDFSSEMRFANGIRMTAGMQSAEKPSGVMFKGTKGWMFISVGGAGRVTASDPVAIRLGKTLQASDPSILTSVIGDNETRLYVSNDHHGNWLDSIKTRNLCVSTAEIAHRTNSICLLQHIAMKLGRTLKWDPHTEMFVNDDEANTMIARDKRPHFAF